ncbi:aminoacylase-1-like [Toxorhynchites rutilus septentrionalis]|uniref:aminoacylase-1-like n=1 Tax=Toxorhynchites rutilus septentrionalis TaxID=329112 RepID=UPI00247A615F|nr:aminoacylase-1-like [Toxorhynchites rutilus septentrionalis]
MHTEPESKYNTWESNEDIQMFREYLRIPSVHPDVNYDECVEFLRRTAAHLDLPVAVLEIHPRKPIVIITWEGTEASLPSIVLNSHMDVVPVYADKWTYPPFSAHMDPEGRIYARGSQDMKCVGAQFLASIRALKNQGIRLKRTLHVLFVPDEEIGGTLGMKAFVGTEQFGKLNCGFAIDEAVASPDDTFMLFFGEKTRIVVNFIIPGTSGHGSLLLQETAGEKARKLIDRMMDYRNSQQERLDNDQELTVGDVTTVNLTMMSGGVQNNVIPPEFKISFDIRVAHDTSIDAFEAQLQKWCEESGGDIHIDYEQKDSLIELTKLDETNHFWMAFKAAVNEMGIAIRTHVCPGATDARFLRELGIPAVGFSPMNNTPTLLHDHDEFLHAETFLRGIEIYKKLITAVANA